MLLLVWESPGPLGVSHRTQLFGAPRSPLVVVKVVHVFQDRDRLVFDGEILKTRPFFVIRECCTTGIASIIGITGGNHGRCISFFTSSFVNMANAGIRHRSFETCGMCRKPNVLRPRFRIIRFIHFIIGLDVCQGPLLVLVRSKNLVVPRLCELHQVHVLLCQVVASSGSPVGIGLTCSKLARMRLAR